MVLLSFSVVMGYSGVSPGNVMPPSGGCGNIQEYVPDARYTHGQQLSSFFVYGSFTVVVRARYYRCSETLFAFFCAFAAFLAICDAVPVIQKKCPFQLRLFAHPPHFYHPPSAGLILHLYCHFSVSFPGVFSSVSSFYFVFDTFIVKPIPDLFSLSFSSAFVFYCQHPLLILG